MVTRVGGGTRRPTVVMAHGTSATLRMVALDCARVSASAGLAALVYDHRNFGCSDGEPRLEINPWIQCRGYMDALAFAGTHPADAGLLQPVSLRAIRTGRSAAHGRPGRRNGPRELCGRQTGVRAHGGPHAFESCRARQLIKGLHLMQALFIRRRAADLSPRPRPAPTLGVNIHCSQNLATARTVRPY